tara:strand:+ start:5591 stop:6370 length:780 start_codon:yes stop_codon:yes gene_type:complete
MNAFKALVALLAGAIVLLFLPQVHWSQAQVYFLLSGISGLFIGDMLLFKAFTLLGPGRSLVLYGFHPFFVGLVSYYLFDQVIHPWQWLSIIFLIACLLTFSLENKRMYQTWGLKGSLFALAGILLDAAGVLLSKYGFEHSDTHFLQANAIRSFAAAMCFAGFIYFRKLPFFSVFVLMSTKQKSMVTLGSFMGTFLALSLYMWAIDIGHLATISAIAVTTPFLAAFFESLYEKKWPSPYFLLALVFFVIGFSLLVLPGSF